MDVADASTPLLDASTKRRRWLKISIILTIVFFLLFLLGFLLYYFLVFLAVRDVICSSHVEFEPSFKFKFSGSIKSISTNANPQPKKIAVITTQISIFSVNKKQEIIREYIPTPTLSSDETFGNACVFNYDNNVLIVSGTKGSNRGKIWLFVQSMPKPEWYLANYMDFDLLGGKAYETFGQSLAWSGDRIYVSCPDCLSYQNGAVLMFDIGRYTITYKGYVSDTNYYSFGTSLAVNADYLLVTTEDEILILHKKPSGSWERQGTFSTDIREPYGPPLSIPSENNKFLLRDFYRPVLIYRNGPSNWAIQVQDGVSEYTSATMFSHCVDSDGHFHAITLNNQWKSGKRELWSGVYDSTSFMPRIHTDQISNTYWSLLSSLPFYQVLFSSSEMQAYKFKNR